MNIIVILADSLRVDHLGCYGISIKKSDKLDPEEQNNIWESNKEIGNNLELELRRFAEQLS